VEKIGMTLKYNIRLFLVASIGITCLLNGCKKDDEQASSSSNPSEKTLPLKALIPTPMPSITKGNTRISLLHFGRTTSWSNEFVHGSDAENSLYAIPGVFMEFYIERLNGESPEGGPNIYNIRLFQNGQVLPTLKSVIKGGSGANENYSEEGERYGFKRPLIKDDVKAYIISEYIRGKVLDSGNVMISLEGGFGEEELKFVFEDISLY
jgi:hypothetical protein